MAHPLLDMLAPGLRRVIGQTPLLHAAEELRIRAAKPLLVLHRGRYQGLDKRGQPCLPADGYHPASEEIVRTLQLMTQNSWYAWEEELSHGFITLPGGCRVGITGRAVVANNQLQTIKHPNGLSIRFAREIKGCAAALLGPVRQSRPVCSTLIIAPPGCGKTTLLRDLCRQVSDMGVQTVLLDERSELAACLQGCAQLDVGQCTDVLDACPKTLGFSMVLRGMAPELVVTDEIGHEQDAQALHTLARSGVKIMTTSHGSSIQQVQAQSWARKSWRVFECIILLSRKNGPGTIEHVLNAGGRAYL